MPEERSWYMVKGENDGRYYLRCRTCRKTLIVYTKTEARIVAQGASDAGRLTTEGWQSKITCPVCGATVEILLKDVYAACPYRARPNAVRVETAPAPGDPWGQSNVQIPFESLVGSLIEDAQALAASDTKHSRRSNRGWRIEPEFWQWLAGQLYPAQDTGIPPLPDILTDWQRVCDASSMPVVYNAMDARRLIGFFVQAVGSRLENGDMGMWREVFSEWYLLNRFVL